MYLEKNSLFYLISMIFVLTAGSNIGYQYWYITICIRFFGLGFLKNCYEFIVYGFIVFIVWNTLRNREYGPFAKWAFRTWFSKKIPKNFPNKHTVVRIGYSLAREERRKFENLVEENAHDGYYVNTCFLRPSITTLHSVCTHRV